MKKFVLIFVTAVAVASVSVFAAYNLPENTDASKYENTYTMASTVINKKPAEFTTSPNVDMTGFELTKNSPSNYKNGRCFNSDSEIVYNNDLNRLEIIWRYTDYDIDYASLLMSYSYDGNTWSKPETFFETYDRKKEDMVSPGIVYDSGTYRVWYVNAYKVKYRELKDGKWSKIRMCKLPYENDAFTWHIDLIKNNDKYEILTCATEDKQDRKHMNLYYAKSDDGLKFGTAKKVLEPTGNDFDWDGNGLYRSTFMYSDGMYYVLYGGRNDAKNFGVGLLFGKDMYNLYGTNCDYINDGVNSAGKFWNFIDQYKDFSSESEISEEGFKVDG